MHVSLAIYLAESVQEHVETLVVIEAAHEEYLSRIAARFSPVRELCHVHSVVYHRHPAGRSADGDHAIAGPFADGDDWRARAGDAPLQPAADHPREGVVTIRARVQAAMRRVDDWQAGPEVCPLSAYIMMAVV